MVVKDAQPNDPQDFSFTAGGGLSPVELRSRRRRRRDALQHAHVHERAARQRLLPLRDRAERLGPDGSRPATTAARSRTSPWRRARPSPAPSRTASAARSRSRRTRSRTTRRTSRSRPAAGSHLRPSRSTTTSTRRCRTRTCSRTCPSAPATPSPRPCPAAGTRRARPATTAARSRTSACPPVSTSRARSRTRKRGTIVVVKDARPERRAGLRLHGRRRALAVELQPRRRLRRDALEHAHVHERRCPAAATRSPRPCRAAGTRPPRPATTAARVEHRRRARGDRHLHVHERASAAGSWSSRTPRRTTRRTSRSRPAAASRPTQLLARRRLRRHARRTRARSRTSPPASGYSLSETVPSGWDQTAATCDDGSPVSNIDVAAGETVTCTFANRKRGSLVVVEDAVPNDAQDFSLHDRRRPVAGQLRASTTTPTGRCPTRARSRTSSPGRGTRCRRRRLPDGISTPPRVTTAARCRAYPSPPERPSRARSCTTATAA